MDDLFTFRGQNFRGIVFHSVDQRIIVLYVFYTTLFYLCFILVGGNQRSDFFVTKYDGD